MYRFVFFQLNHFEKKDCRLTFNGKIRVGAVPDSKIEKYLYGNKYGLFPICRFEQRLQPGEYYACNCPSSNRRNNATQS